MIRFRNPGTQYTTQIQLIQQLYAALKDQASFTLDDMALVAAQSGLLTARGYAGKEALRRSKTKQDSLNSAKMNVKLYAETLRMLGWLTPCGERTSYPMVFTYIGAHMGLAAGDCSRLYEQCVLGVTYPTQFTQRMHYSEKVRFFLCALRTLRDMGGVLYKHELCLGPMSLGSDDETSYQQMLASLRALRGSRRRLDAAMDRMAADLGISTVTMDNYTRIPIALMKNCHWIEGVTDNTIYGEPLHCLRLTDHGRAVCASAEAMLDLRLEEYLTQPPEQQAALIRLGTYGMLQRAGYDMTDVADRMAQDRALCAGLLQGKELLFSPCQVLRRLSVEQALGIRMDAGTATRQNLDPFLRPAPPQPPLQTWNLNLSGTAATTLLTLPEDRNFLDRVERLKDGGASSDQIVTALFDGYRQADKTVFYPLVATLFKVMGYDCHFSRAGDNCSRWDAIIRDPVRSIPIEIKSPAEETHLSIKAIRQALENKIVLLSRRTYLTTPEVTTLAVGYYLPNERADVARLIADIQATYGYRVGVMDLRSLLCLAVSILVDRRSFDKEQLYRLEGLMHADLRTDG